MIGLLVESPDRTTKEIRTAVLTLLNDLLLFLDDADADLRSRVRIALRGFGGDAKQALRILERAIDHASSREKLDICYTIVSIQPQHSRVANWLIECLQDGNTDVRLDTLGVLRGLGPQAEFALNEVVTRLSDAEPQIRVGALDVLRAIGPPSRKVSHLIRLMQKFDQDEDVRSAAERALFFLE